MLILKKYQSQFPSQIVSNCAKFRWQNDTQMKYLFPLILKAEIEDIWWELTLWMKFFLSVCLHHMSKLWERTAWNEMTSYVTNNSRCYWGKRSSLATKRIRQAQLRRRSTFLLERQIENKSLKNFIHAITFTRNILQFLPVCARPCSPR